MFSILNERLAGLRQRYSEPHRAYHGQAHVDALLSGFADEGLHVENGVAAPTRVYTIREEL